MEQTGNKFNLFCADLILHLQGQVSMFASRFTFEDMQVASLSHVINV